MCPMPALARTVTADFGGFVGYELLETLRLTVKLLLPVNLAV